jgi:hypothetical protein
MLEVATGMVWEVGCAHEPRPYSQAQGALVQMEPFSLTVNLASCWVSQTPGETLAPLT